MPIHTPAAPATSAAAIAAAGRDAARGHHRPVGQREHLLQQRQGRPLAGVPAGLGALHDDDVDAGVERAVDVGGRVDLGADRDPRVVQRPDVGRRVAEGHRHQARAAAAIVASKSSGRVSSTQIISPTPKGSCGRGRDRALLGDELGRVARR